MNHWKEDDNFLGRWLDNSLAGEELQAFKSSEDYAKYEKIIQTLDELEAPVFEADAIFDNISQKIRQTQTQPIPATQKRLKRYYSFYVAASFIILVGLGYGLIYWGSLSGGGRNGTFSYATLTGEKHALTLPDGSSVKLNVFSKIQYRVQDWDTQRLLDMDGEAFFEVKSGQTFTVATQQGKIEVLGTTFNVKKRGDVLDVFCYGGKVKVKTNRFERTLQTGQGIRARNQQLEKIRQSGFAKSPGWLQGISELEDVTLSEALEELRWHFGVRVVAHELDLKQYQFTGDFPHEDVHLSIKLLLDPFEQLTYQYDANSKILRIQTKK